MTHADGREAGPPSEAGRLMTICNSCRYCEGLCAVFPAMELRRAFSVGDLNYLSNLCHNCGACFDACQFSPPHEFDVNVPLVLAQRRADSYASYAWPRTLAVAFRWNGVVTALAVGLSIAAFLIVFAARGDGLVTVERGPGAFYKFLPHNAMALLFGAVSVFAILSLAISLVRFWRDIGSTARTTVSPRAVLSALHDIATLKYLHGGGQGCSTQVDAAPDRRRWSHHLVFYGFLLCFASTSVATAYHYLGGWEAPYALFDLPVVLGTVGGVLMVAGTMGIAYYKGRTEPQLHDRARSGFDVAFITSIFAVALTGLLLLIGRSTSAMGVLLAIHLGFVLALFLMMPYGKFVHGLYRGIALLRFAYEQAAVAESGTRP